MTSRSIGVFAACLLWFGSVPAMANPPAELEELSWLAGGWTGTGIDNAPAGETYSAPAGGQMVGHFYQLASDGGVRFYELISFAPDGEGSLHLRLKHFNADMSGWEGKAAEEALVFPLTEKGPNHWRFSAVTFYREGEDGLRITVEVSERDGSRKELLFRFKHSLR